MAILVHRLWRRVSVEDLDGSWAAVVDRLTLIVSAAQLGAAKAGAAYVPATLAAGGTEVAPAGAVAAARWAGIASDGRPLDSLLYSSVVHTREQLGPQGATQALEAGGKQLDMLARTQVADAARGAAGVAIAARPRVGYVRMVSPPCCQRCAVLAGKPYKWNDGFLRHPKCDCRHIPTAEDAPSGFTGTISADQVRDLTADQRRAVSDGADLNQVINAHRRGARSKDGMTTSEGGTRRGVYGGYRRNADGSLTKLKKGEKAPKRLTPEGIYRLSATREEALGFLRKFGYLL